MSVASSDFHEDDRYLSILVEAVNRAFVKLSGDPTSAVAAAAPYASHRHPVEDWITSQRHVAAAGALLYVLPLLHLKALIPEVAWVLRQMSRGAWGVGHLLGAAVDGKADLEVILGIWSGAISCDTIDLELRSAYRAGHLVWVGRALRAAPSLAQFLVDGGAATATPIAVADGLAKITMARKIASKIAAKLLPKLACKAGLGLLSVIGAGVVARMNSSYVREFGTAARAYYRAKRYLQNTVVES